jgi:hypothetical protein
MSPGGSCGAQGAIVVTGYPHSFEPAPRDTHAAIIAAINEATDELNATIEQAITVAHRADVNIVYVDVTPEFADPLSPTRPVQTLLSPECRRLPRLCRSH